MADESKKDDVDILETGDIADALKEAFDGTDENEEIVIDEAFITDEDDTVHSAADVLSNWSRQSLQSFGERVLSQKRALSQERAEIEKAQREVARELVAKTASGSTQQVSELGQNKFTVDVSKVEIVEPPYPPELLSAFLEVDETHFRCVRTKVTDSVGRDYELIPTVTVQPSTKNDATDGTTKAPTMESGPNTYPIVPEGVEGVLGNDPWKDPEPLTEVSKSKTMIEKIVGRLLPNQGANGSPKSTRKRVVDQEEIDAEVQIVEDFIDDANEVVGFEGVIDRACMDYEGIGWAAIEVVRSRDMKTRRIAHAPAVRMKALKGWKGFVEVVSNNRSDGSQVSGGKHIYYQTFGDKVTSKRLNPFTQTYEPYDPKIDGQPNPTTCRWNLIDRETGKSTDDLTRAANEIIWIPRHHSNTIYYGYTDVVPALGWLLANVHIRDYLLQFFEHNTVPRYAIIIEGAKMAEPVKKAITSYFSTHVKGKAHKTLIVPIPAMRGEVKVRFERLDADVNEGSFQQTKKNNAQSIMAAHGVSPGIIGITEQSELGSGKGLSQAEIYKDRIVTPSQKYWSRKLNHMFRRGLGIMLVGIKFNPLDIRDEKAEMDVLTGYLMHGCTTINAIKKRAGLGDPIAGGDRAFIVMGSTIMFVDEMTEAMGTEREELEMALEQTKNEMAQKAEMESIKQQAERKQASAQNKIATPKAITSNK